MILPADYKGDYEASSSEPDPSGWRNYTPKVGASFVRNPDYWGRKPLRIASSSSSTTSSHASSPSKPAKSISSTRSPSTSARRSLNPDINILRVSRRTGNSICGANRALHRQARAPGHGLCVDRNKLVDGLCRGMATIGNDSPFSPGFPHRTVRSAARPRHRQSKAIAGRGRPGERLRHHAHNHAICGHPGLRPVVPELRQGVDVRVALNIENQDQYYGKAVFGQSDWLEVRSGSRIRPSGRPQRVPSEPLRQRGQWNAAHFKNPAYDSLVPNISRRWIDPCARRRETSRTCCWTRRRSYQLFPRSAGADPKGSLRAAAYRGRLLLDQVSIA